MTQYDELIREKAEQLAAEEWGNQVKYIHASNGVMEIAYNNGLKRFEETKPGGKKWTTGERKTKQTIFESFGRWMADQRG